MEVPEVPILIGNLIVPIVAMLGALLLAWGMLADVLDLCRIVGEISYDVGVLYEVAQSLPGNVVVHYSGPTECRIRDGVINCSFFTVDFTGIKFKATSSHIYTSSTFIQSARHFTTFAKITVADEYVDDAGFKERTFYVYRGISQPAPRNSITYFKIGKSDVSIEKGRLADPLPFIYNKAKELIDSYEGEEVENTITIVLEPNERLRVIDTKLCLDRRIDLLPGDLNMINETIKEINITYYYGKEIVSLENFDHVVCRVDSDGSTDVTIYYQNSDFRSFDDVEEIWYYKTLGCLNYSALVTNVNIDSSCDDLEGRVWVKGYEVPGYVDVGITLTYDGSVLGIRCET